MCLNELMTSVFRPPALKTSTEASRNRGALATRSEGVRALAVLPVYDSCSRAAKCAPISDPPDPVHSSGASPSELTAEAKLVTLALHAHQYVAVNKLSSCAYGFPISFKRSTFVPGSACQTGSYLCVNACSRQFVCWAISRWIDAALAVDAPESALLVGQPPAGLIHYCGRAVKYASVGYVACLLEVGAEVNAAAKANP